MNFLNIVGFGPRGLHALESFLLALSRKRIPTNVAIAIIEKQQKLGAGSAWDSDQPDANWINISDRALKNLLGREAIQLENLYIESFPGFIEWTENRLDHKVSDSKDTFFRRKIMGEYLSERSKSLTNPLSTKSWFQIVHKEVVHLETINGINKLTTSDREEYFSKHTLLTLGHLKTKLSKQDKAFTEHASNSSAHFVSYPYTKSAYQIIRNSDHIAVKGLGLSMIDVVHLALEKQEGEFSISDKKPFLNYINTTGHKVVVTPFSLDGLPPVPKPLGLHVDKQFTPNTSQKKKLEFAIAAMLSSPKHLIVEDLLEPIVNIIAELYEKLQERGTSNTNDLIRRWLLDPRIKDDLILDTSLPITTYMSQTCLMACGNIPASLDYFIGQVWRNLQPLMYPLFTHATLDQKLKSDFIAVDERTKRYSYGPPVARILQLIAIEAEGSLHLDYVNDPDIREVKNGWNLSNDKKEITVNTLVNGVLASPNLSKIDDDLINKMYAENYLEPFQKELGIRTNEYAQVLNESGTVKHISVLGRNAKGSVYGVDAILECFSEKVVRWADQLAEEL